MASTAIGLADDETAKLWRAFVLFSHVDGDCGAPPWNMGCDPSCAALSGCCAEVASRYARLKGRPVLAIDQCNQALASKYFLNVTMGVGADWGFHTCGFANHNDSWVLRPTKAREYLQMWVAKALEIPGSFVGN
jgi:hypothetical protein